MPLITNALALTKTAQVVIMNHKFSGGLVNGGDFHRFSITNDSKGVVYLADQQTDGVDEDFVTYDHQVMYLPLLRR